MKKTTTAGKEIIQGLNEALSYMQGKDVSGIRVTTVTVPDVKQIRERLNLSQSRFAEKFGFSVALVRNWEQGRNRPDSTARILLTVIDRHPEVVEDAIRSLKRAS